MKKMKKLIVVWFSIGKDEDCWSHECEEKEFKEVFHSSMDELIKYHEVAGHKVKSIEFEEYYPPAHEMSEG